MIVKRVEVIHKFLVVLHRDVGFGLLNAFDFALVTCELFFYLFDYSLVVFYFLLDFFVRYSLRWIALFLQIRDLLLWYLLRQTGLNHEKDTFQLWIKFSNVSQRFQIYLSLFSSVDVAEISQSLQFIFYFFHRCRAFYSLIRAVLLTGQLISKVHFLFGW